LPTMAADIFVRHNWANEPRPIRFARSARRHRIGRLRVMVVLATAAVEVVAQTETEDARLEWVGIDHMGLRIHVVALDLPEVILVIHAMPVFKKIQGHGETR